MAEKKELNQEELEKVTGGCYGLTDPKVPTFKGYQNMYSLDEKKEYYFVYLHYEQQHWCKGKVIKTWEESTGWFNTTRRQHKIELTDVGSLYLTNSVGDIIQLFGDNTAAYTSRG